MIEPKSLKYSNITISGLPGAGSSTLGQGLEEELGWKYFGGGDFMREYAVKKGVFDKKARVHHSAAVYEDEFDREVDYGMRQRLEKEEGLILEAWLSGFMALELKRVLKILVYCQNDVLRVDRLVNRDGVSIEEAKEHIFKREEENLTKWSRLYRKEWQEWVPEELREARSGKWLDFFNPKLYDLAIDTYSNDRQISLEMVLRKLGVKAV